ncbi:MAG: toll/interleukin-1 receptor domain-containing protein [Microcystis sp.]
MKDVFICHASEDKPGVVEPLVDAFEQANISYWYDKAEIKWGDSITKKVNEGLRISHFVIVVISKAFLSKNFPQTELYSTLDLLHNFFMV